MCRLANPATIDSARSERHVCLLSPFLPRRCHLAGGVQYAVWRLLHRRFSPSCLEKSPGHDVNHKCQLPSALRWLLYDIFLTMYNK
ncbi:hypothetical protein OI70_00650 [Dickeya fangzhongdai]|nr:hypothetical protein OI70_00650 [Dickeya fangzhongdai]